MCSSLMLVVNKATLSVFPFPGSLGVVQYAASAAAVLALSAAGVVDAEPLRWARVRQFWSVTLVFCATIFANMLVLQHGSVETVVVFRCTVPLVTAVCDFAFLGTQLPSARSWVSLITVLLGSLVYVRSGAGLDVTTLRLALFYVGLLAFEMVYVKHVMNTVDMSTFTRVLYNNALSCAFGTALTSASGELRALAAARRDDVSVDSLAHVCALVVASCGFGLAISYFGFGFRARVSATTFTVVGVMCKVVSVSASLLLLRSDWTARGLLGLGLCLVGGACYQQAPMRTRATDSSAELQQLLAGHYQRKRALLS